MVTYCEENDLKQYLLSDYLKAAEEINEGIVFASIENASGEIAEMLSEKYTVPNPPPAVIRRICSVMAAYRVVSAITTLVKEEGSSNNDFLPLQRLYTESMNTLKSIAAGGLKISGLINAGENNMAVETRRREFNLRGY